MSTNLFAVDAGAFESFDASGGGSSEKVKIADLNGHTVVIVPNEYIANIETVHGSSDAVNATIHDIDGGKTYESQLIFNRVLVNGLKEKVGKRVLGVVGKGNAKAGKSAPWVLLVANEEQTQAAAEYLAAV